MQFLTILSATAALFGTALAVPAKGGAAKPVANTNKATGGPASASVTIYQSYTCTDGNTAPPADTAGGTTVSVVEGGCAIVNIPVGGAFTASLTAPPKAGAAGCYIQLFRDQGCGVTLSNQYHGFPFNGANVGNTVGCAAPPVQSYGALQVLCH